ncbi:aldo/keto reductase [Actinoplanes lobatus]|uniref:Aldo/keto reductase n=1 Tax=Actinoplanes lobatus TaxID=113568 RepID=A0A7W7HJA7_9ACTN|nr:aldo/keto reductase [Actinoplanes lobatus]MBB4751574.1 aryl-alcohol dehydrogenase-like predicted oxidoreductase [Actinoplanes lobatus]GGN64765.1 aldo/keto reductase [Actinoplanes lobatus]GIE43158.1 aldo/keto reductase [Actinoplanes lobatus]
MSIPLRPFGRTGVKVSALALGTMMFGERGNPDHHDSIRIIHRALDAGINLVDTADVYSQGESEEIVGKALKNRRDDVFLATKFHGQIGTDPNHFGNSRRWIVREVEHSLRRLRTDHIDLYQVHRPEEDTDFDETLGALSDLVHQGKIRYIGTSTFEPSAIVEGQWIAEKRGRERVVSEQPPYSILARGIEREVLPIAQRYGLAVIPWSPLAGGWLSGKFRAGAPQPATTRGGRQPGRFEIGAPENAGKLAAVEALALLAEQSGLSLIHLALGFVLEHPAVTAPIIGPRTLEQLEDQLGAAQVRLSRDVLDEIDKIVPPGVTLSARDQGYQPPSVTDPARRRRSAT